MQLELPRISRNNLHSIKSGFWRRKPLVSAISLLLWAVGGLGEPSSIHGKFGATVRGPQQDL